MGLNGAPLKTALHNIIKNHTVVQYSDLWTSFQTTDKKPNGEVWDMYTDIPTGTPVYIFQFGINQCGNYNAEGVCYNREHTWPKEYFGGDDSYPMYSDLHHLFATDGWVNNKHAAFPYGKVTTATYTSSNGTKLGNGTSYTGYTDKIFEPIDEYKGDFARAYFYMSTRYEGEDASWQNWTMANGATLTTSAINILLAWHHADPVSQKETDRNNAVFAIQNNRNPFVDFPEFADCIWGTGDCSTIGTKEVEIKNYITISPNPAISFMQIGLKNNNEKIKDIYIYDITGKELMNTTNTRIDLSTISNGMYLIKVNTSAKIYFTKFTKE